MKRIDCRCDKPSPGGLTIEPCTRPVTQEDFLCDACRKGCAVIEFTSGGKRIAGDDHAPRWSFIDQMVTFR
jgi:hypothetical protein